MMIKEHCYPIQSAVSNYSTVQAQINVNIHLTQFAMFINGA